MYKTPKLREYHTHTDIFTKCIAQQCLSPGLLVKQLEAKWMDLHAASNCHKTIYSKEKAETQIQCDVVSMLAWCFIGRNASSLWHSNIFWWILFVFTWAVNALNLNN